MSGKIIVHKFEEKNKIKTLHITIGFDKDKSDIKFSDWEDGKIEMKKKEKEKPRLVVKMVSKDNFNRLNFDSCFKEVDYTDKYHHGIIDTNSRVKVSLKENYTINSKIAELGSSLNMHNKYSINIEPMVINDMPQEYNMLQSYTKQFHFDNKRDNGIDPLENCLEKVKKNNALIMENIHLLNRTLNYAKNKEILEMINPKSLRSYPCNVCGKCFVYETGLHRHYTVRHANLDTPPRWQLVWTCTKCFQVWPRQDLAITHANQCSNSTNIDFIQEIKTSLLLKCEFCEKVFTCIPRLLRHAKMHMVTKNYECNACDLAFSCYKTAEQHWMSCVWLKMCYEFSLPQMLLCNVCDRKFRNYDQLYNHRYKVGHFISKKFEKNNCVHSVTLVYQCEICGQGLNAISQLLVHRSQFHAQFDNGASYNIDTSTIIEDS